MEDPRPDAMLEAAHFPPLPHMWNGFTIVNCGGAGDGCLVREGSLTLCGYKWSRPSHLTEPECRSCFRVATGEAMVEGNPGSDAEFDEGWDEPVGPWNYVR